MAHALRFFERLAGARNQLEHTVVADAKTRKRVKKRAQDIMKMVVYSKMGGKGRMLRAVDALDLSDDKEAALGVTVKMGATWPAGTGAKLTEGATYAAFMLTRFFKFSFLRGKKRKYLPRDFLKAWTINIPLYVIHLAQPAIHKLLKKLQRGGG